MSTSTPPYNPDLSPWYNEFANRVSPQPGYFTLPPSSQLRRTDTGLYHGEWESLRDHALAVGHTVERSSTLHTALDAYARKIVDDPELYQRMQDWAAGEYHLGFWLPRGTRKIGENAAPANPPNFIVKADSPELSEAVQRFAFGKGLGWSCSGKEVYRDRFPHIIFARLPQDGIGQTPNTIYHTKTPTYNLPVYDAATQFGEIVRILNTPVEPPKPKAPVIQGHTVIFHEKPHYHVRIGCAMISMHVIDTLVKLGDGQLPSNNRTIKSVTSDKGEVLTIAEARQIQEYVEELCHPSKACS